MQQERDSESHRAKLAESRFAAMKDKAGEYQKLPGLWTMKETVFPAKLQNEVRRLQDALEERRLNRLESSETILQDARARLESLHNSVSKMSQLQTPLLELVNS